MSVRRGAKLYPQAREQALRESVDSHNLGGLVLVKGNHYGYFSNTRFAIGGWSRAFG